MLPQPNKWSMILWSSWEDGFIIEIEVGSSFGTICELQSFQPE